MKICAGRSSWTWITDMDVARCRCPKDPEGGTHRDCPFHGESDPNPRKPYALTENDKQFLKSQRIAPFDHSAMQAVRQADEDRFKSE